MLVLGVLKQGLGCDFDRHDDASFRRQVRPGNSGPNQWRCCAVRKLTRNIPYPQTR